MTDCFQIPKLDILDAITVQDKLNGHRNAKCCLCLKMNPVAIKTNCCDFLMCRSCLEKTAINHPACPNCCADRFTHLDKMSIEHLQDVTITCQHKKDGCQWEGNINVYLSHLSAECIFADKVCDECRKCVLNENIKLNLHYVKTYNVHISLNIQEQIKRSGHRYAFVNGASDCFWIREKFQFIFICSWQKSNDVISICVKPTNLPHGLTFPKLNECLKRWNVTVTLRKQHDQEHNCLQAQMVYAEEKRRHKLPHDPDEQVVGYFEKDNFKKLGLTSQDDKRNQDVLYFHLSFQMH